MDGWATLGAVTLGARTGNICPFCSSSLPILPPVLYLPLPAVSAGPSSATLTVVDRRVGKCDLLLPARPRTDASCINMEPPVLPKRRRTTARVGKGHRPPTTHSVPIIGGLPARVGVSEGGGLVGMQIGGGADQSVGRGKKAPLPAEGWAPSGRCGNAAGRIGEFARGPLALHGMNTRTTGPVGSHVAAATTQAPTHGLGAN